MLGATVKMGLGRWVGLRAVIGSWKIIAASRPRQQQPGLHWSASSYLILLEMTELGFGWAELPRWVVKRFGAAELKELQVHGWPRSIRVHVIWSRERGLGQAGAWLCNTFLQTPA